MQKIQFLPFFDLSYIEMKYTVWLNDFLILYARYQIRFRKITHLGGREIVESRRGKYTAGWWFGENGMRYVTQICFKYHLMSRTDCLIIKVASIHNIHTAVHAISVQ